MELTQTTTRTIYQVVAEQDGWKLYASVTMQDEKVNNVDGNAQKEGKETVSFNAWRNGESLARSIHNVTDGMADVYEVMEAFIASIEEKYNA